MNAGVNAVTAIFSAAGLALAGLVAGWLLHRIAEVVARLSGVEQSPSFRAALSCPPAFWQIMRRQPAEPALFATELAGAVFSVVIRLHLGLTGQAFALLAMLAFFVLIALIDFKYRWVPNLLTYPAMLGVLAWYAFVARPNMLYVLLGGAFAFGIFGLTAWLQPGKLGGGDVKLATLIGIGFGFPQVMAVLLVGGGLGGVISAALLLGKCARRDDTIPYAPFLCFGAAAILLFNVLTI